MGGKPFQSKGCATCRRRKLKCDEQRPCCLRCIKHGTSCPGYEGQRIIPYHHQEQRNSPDYLKSSPPDPVFHQHLFVDPGLDVRLGPSVRDQIISSFICLHFPSVAAHGLAVDTFQFLFTGIVALPKKTLMLEQAISAISCVFIGKLDNNVRMLHHGVQLYNRSIRQMSQILKRKTYSQELLYVSVIFQELEAIHCPDGLMAYVTHVAGLNSLIKHYRSLVLESPLTATIYHWHQKFKVLLVGYMEMSEEDYEYLSQSTQNEPFLEMIHILADLALLCQKSSSLCISNYAACESLLFACLTQKNKQEDWYARSEKKIGGHPSLYGQDFYMWPTNGLFGPAYRFISLDNAKLHILLWNASTILYSLIHRARVSIMSHTTTDARRGIESSPSQDVEYVRSIAYADRISRSLPYFTQPGINARGTYSLVSAVRQIAKIYCDARDSEKFRWTLTFLAFLAKYYDVAARAREIISAWWPGDKISQVSKQPNSEKRNLDFHWSWKCRLQGD